MKIQTLLCRASFWAAVTAMTLAFDAAAIAISQPVTLPTGATITPDAAPGSVFQPLTVDLPDYPNRAVDGAEVTAAGFSRIHFRV